MLLESLDIHLQKQISKNPTTDFTPFTRTNSIWITDWNEICSTIKLLENNIRENQGTLGLSVVFLRYNIKSTIHERNNWKLGFYENLKCILCKRDCQETGKIRHRIGKNIKNIYLIKKQKWKKESEVAQSCPTLRSQGL